MPALGSAPNPGNDSVIHFDLETHSLFGDNDMRFLKTTVALAHLCLSVFIRG